MLARWSHPLAGIIAPDVFIPIAEEIGVIGPAVGAGHPAALLRSARLGPVDQDLGQHLAVPVRRRLARRAHRPDPDRDRLSRPSGWWSRSPKARCSPTSILRGTIVTSLKNQGIRLALDDFGTGFSSLSHLRSLPFDMIKIDRSFVTNIHESGQSAAIVRAVATLADALAVPVCVEGIENEAAHAAVLAHRLLERPGLVFRQADGGRPGARSCSRAAGRRRRLADASPSRAA